MIRYVAIPKADWDEPPHISEVSSREVVVADDTPKPTGLFDASGTPLYSVREKLPFGFVKA